MQDEISEIKSRIDIVDIVSKYLPLKRAGKYFKANCPFHSEKTASFMVNPDLQIFKCFGCNVGGDVFSFVQKIENLDFSETLKILAKEAGVELKFKSQNSKEKSFEDPILKINKIATDVFKKILFSDSAKKVLNYLTEKRKLSHETIERFELGASSTQRDFLASFLIQKGIDKKTLLKTGLFLESQNFKFGIFDRFVGRLMIPIKNSNGEVVGFTSRVVEDFTDPQVIKTSGKYVNSPETEVFKKSKLLFGFFENKSEIIAKNEIIFVEGQMDVITSFQHGLKNVVASSGTSVTEDQLKFAKRYAENFVFAFDNDEAGERATDRAINFCGSLRILPKVVQFQKLKVKNQNIENEKNLQKNEIQQQVQDDISIEAGAKHYLSIKDLDEFFTSGATLKDFEKLKVSFEDYIIGKIKFLEDKKIEGRKILEMISEIVESFEKPLLRILGNKIFDQRSSGNQILKEFKSSDEIILLLRKGKNLQIQKRGLVRISKKQENQKINLIALIFVSVKKKVTLPKIDSEIFFKSFDILEEHVRFLLTTTEINFSVEIFEGLPREEQEEIRLKIFEADEVVAQQGVLALKDTLKVAFLKYFEKLVIEISRLILEKKGDFGFLSSEQKKINNLKTKWSN
ncbi:MAG: DNA primase [Patescibacteria group bacterium]